MKEQNPSTTTAPESAAVYAPVMLVGNKIYVHVTSDLSPGTWVAGRLHAIVTILEYANELAPEDANKNMAHYEALSLAAECQKVAEFCDQNALF